MKGQTKDNLLYEVQESGEVHVTDMISGVILNQENLYGMTTEDKRVILPNGMERLPTWRYSEAYADVILDLIVQGKTITKITNMEGMPTYQSILKWKATVPAFKERLLEARRSRAELWHDEIVRDKDVIPDTPAEAQHEKLKFEKLKYLAEKNNPEEFGQKQIHAGDRNNPIRLIVDTGIKRIAQE